MTYICVQWCNTIIVVSESADTVSVLQLVPAEPSTIYGGSNSSALAV